MKGDRTVCLDLGDLARTLPHLIALDSPMTLH